jgi:hypothetical protein
MHFCVAPTHTHTSLFPAGRERTSRHRSLSVQTCRGKENRSIGPCPFSGIPGLVACRNRCRRNFGHNESLGCSDAKHEIGRLYTSTVRKPAAGLPQKRYSRHIVARGKNSWGQSGLSCGRNVTRGHMRPLIATNCSAPLEFAR